MRQLACHPNVVLELSGLAGEAVGDRLPVGGFRVFTDTVVKAGGLVHTMFGSDRLARLLAGRYDQIYAAEAACARPVPYEAAMVFEGTATGWYLVSSATLP